MAQRCGSAVSVQDPGPGTPAQQRSLAPEGLTRGYGVKEVKRLSRLAPEDIAGGVLLVVVLTFTVVRPAAIRELFESPLAAATPDGGPAAQLLQRPPL